MKGILKLEDIVKYEGKCEEINCSDCNCPLIETCLLSYLSKGKLITDERRLNIALDLITDEVFFNDTDI